MGEWFCIQYQNSVFYAAAVSVLSLLIAVPTGYALARGKGWIMKGLFWICCVLLFLPFQVTVLPSYILLDRLGLLDTVWAILITGIMSPLVILLMWLGSRMMPQEFEDAFRLESGSLVRYFFCILLPTEKWIVVTAGILNFTLTWNMVDQALVFLERRRLWPLSLGLVEIGADRVDLSQIIWYILPALVGTVVVGSVIAFGEKKYL